MPLGPRRDGNIGVTLKRRPRAAKRPSRRNNGGRRRAVPRRTSPGGARLPALIEEACAPWPPVSSPPLASTPAIGWRRTSERLRAAHCQVAAFRDVPQFGWAPSLHVALAQTIFTYAWP
ncbi:hypothetical protein AAFF_G00330800 [Aldrovandia affinis]|uniref:Uncharacterized protein n=1 Tax=Aldrovandia affinis TaxID=143900 RepID=A0AAD7W0I8_9TELE|nr:hypothetical protein AAFF_G00330800 [Aldrovandia affinis]